MLGWNETTQKGSFTGDFTNQTKGQTLTQTFISEGADIIFPVAGNVGLGAAKAVQQADASAGSQKVNMEWVDVDGCVSAAQYCKYFITSVEKGIVAAVKATVQSVADGSFKGGTYVGTLANGGAVLAPLHDFSSPGPGFAPAGAGHRSAPASRAARSRRRPRARYNGWRPDAEQCGSGAERPHRCHIGSRHLVSLTSR